MCVDEKAFGIWFARHSHPEKKGKHIFMSLKRSFSSFLLGPDVVSASKWKMEKYYFRTQSALSLLFPFVHNCLFLFRLLIYFYSTVMTMFDMKTMWNSLWMEDEIRANVSISRVQNIRLAVHARKLFSRNDAESFASLRSPLHGRGKHLLKFIC